jgi:hypothetical protein
MELVTVEVLAVVKVVAVDQDIMEVREMLEDIPQSRVMLVDLVLLLVLVEVLVAVAQQQ